MRQLAGLLIPATLLVVATSPRGQSVPPSPFGMLEPAISIDADDQRKLDAGEVVVQILPASGRELAVLAAASLSATVPEVESRITDIATLKRSRLVPQIGRFSDPPALQDLAELTLDRADLAAIRDCHPGDCDIKLSSHEIGQLRQATNGKKGAEWAAAANLQFRRIMLDRVRAYLARGLSGVPRYDTGDRQTDLSSVFATLLGHSPFIQSNAPQLGIYLTRFPAVAPAEDASSFLY